MLKTKLFSNTDPECFETTLNELRALLVALSLKNDI